MLALTPNPSWLQGAEYDLAQRRHRLDRRRVPSVTQAIDLAYPNRFACVPADTLAHKAAVGTAVHLAAQYHAEGDLEESSLAKEVETRFGAWRWFTETRRVEPILCETVVCSRDLGLPLRRRRPYIGKLDFLCRVDRRFMVLVDLKTGVPTLARMQTLAYLDALYQQYPELIAIDVQRWAVVLNADGRYVVHVFRDDLTDAHDFRDVLERAYAAPHVDWSLPMATDTHRPEEPPLELPDEEPLPGSPLFELPDIGPPLPTPPASMFDLPDEPPPAAAAEVLPAEAGPPAIRELIITPDVEVYLATLEAAVAPFEAAAQAFARQMQEASVVTAREVAWLGQQSLVAKDREQAIEALFEPAIRKPRGYLDRVYAVKRRVLQGWKTGGETAARRFTTRKRELEEADRRARAEADRKQREQQRLADEAAAAERRRLTEEATKAAQQGQPAAAADLIEQARAVEPVAVPVAPAPAPLAPAADVAGMGSREGWAGEITDMKDALLAAARPDVFREVAAMVESGDLTAGGQSPATHMIATKLRALATELPIIPSTMFAGDPGELKKRAAADRDTLTWPGFTFSQTVTPVRRTRAAK